MGKNNLIITNPQAVEIFSAGWCNLNCNYCYISKINNDYLKSLHQKIINNIKNDNLIKYIKKYYKKENLKSISHWGTEPTLTIKFFIDFYKKIINEFPYLNEINFSSNFMLDPKNLIYFLKNLPKKFNIKIQISHDGKYTDKNRKNGSNDIIINNLLKFIKIYNESNIKHNITLTFKPTISKEDFIDFSKNLYEYYIFFDKLFLKIKKINKKIKIIYNVDPTIVIPDNYTKKDGKNFLKLYNAIENLQKNNDFKIIKPNFNYYNRFKNLFDMKDEFFIKTKMFLCSAGDSNFAINENGNLLSCHRGFYLNSNEYINSLLNDKRLKKYENNDINKINYFKKNYISKGDIKFLIRNRYYQDYPLLSINSMFIRGLELAKNNLISKIYLKETYFLELLSIFIFKLACPMENILKSNSIFINDSSFLLLFGNGVFEKMLYKYIKKEVTYD